ncbi:DEAD/DEAH box helicase [Caldibacillus debilis]
MRHDKHFSIRAYPTEDHHFYLYCLNERGELVSPAQWVPPLFRGHAGSFYGTLLNYAEMPEELQAALPKGNPLRMTVPFLDPYEALELFSQDNFNPFIAWHFDEFTETLLAVAPVIYEQIKSFRWLPDWEKFRETGDFSWIVPDRVWQEFAPAFWEGRVEKGDSFGTPVTLRTFAEQWFRQGIHAFLSRDERLAAKRDGLRQTLADLLRQEADVATVWQNISLKHWFMGQDDPSPLAVALRLEEPKEEGEYWRLETVFRTPSGKLWTPFSGTHKLRKPWKKYGEAIEAIEIRIARALPWLANEEWLKEKEWATEGGMSDGRSAENRTDGPITDGQPEKIPTETHMTEGRAAESRTDDRQTDDRLAESRSEGQPIEGRLAENPTDDRMTDGRLKKIPSAGEAESGTKTSEGGPASASRENRIVPESSRTKRGPSAVSTDKAQVLAGGSNLSGNPVREAAGKEVGLSAKEKWVPILKRELTDDEAWEFLTKASQVIMLLGVEILLPSWWEALKEPEVQLKARVKNPAVSFLGLDALVDFEWRIALQGVELTEEEFEQLVREKRRLLQIGGRWIVLDPAFIKKIQKLMEKAEKQGMRVQDLIEQEMRRDAPEGESGESSEEEADERIFSRIQIEMAPRLKGMIRSLTDLKDLPLLEQPKGLRGTLRPYQIRGMSWLYFLRGHRFGACLADEMGLGKTVQLLAYLLLVKEKEPEAGPALIICPTSVLGNWQKEIERFAPGLKVYLHYGPNRAKGEKFVRKVLGAPPEPVRSLESGGRAGGKDGSGAGKAFLEMAGTVEAAARADGTPGQADETLRHVRTASLPDETAAQPVEKAGRTSGGTGPAEGAAIRADDTSAEPDEAIFRPGDLPEEENGEKPDIVLTTYGLSHIDFAELSSVYWGTIALDEAQNIKNAGTKQSRAIRKIKGAHHVAMTGTPMENRLSELWSIFDFINKGYLGSQARFQKRFAIPIERDRDEKKSALLRKLISPFLLRRTKKDEEVALNLPEKLEQKEYCPLTPEQAALYEQLIRDTMEKLAHLEGIERRGRVLLLLNQLKQLCDHPALFLKEWKEGMAVSDRLINRSAKMMKLTELFDAILDEGERGLIFTQYIGMGEMIKAALEKRYKIEIPFLNGSLNKAARDKMIEDFQRGKYPVFLLSLKAGGTGLNLTAANHVVHYDRWWNPAVENQATDRAYRIGQTKFVHVHKLITTGTLEEKIDEILSRKQALNDEIIQGEQWIADLTDEELYRLVRLEG